MMDPQERGSSNVNHAKELNFSKTHYEVIKLVKSSGNASQLLDPLMDVSNKGLDSTSSKCQEDNEIIIDRVDDGSTNLMLDKVSSSSCYSSIASFQSNESLQSQVQLRKVYIDGSNVARTHGRNVTFSWPGIRYCVEWFSTRNHRVKVFVPADKCKSIDSLTEDYLKDLEALIETPSGCNDDLFIIEAARKSNGVIVSNDLYRNEKRLNQELERFVYMNRLPYIFDDDNFIPASDPRGRSGPNLDEFLVDTSNESLLGSNNSRQLMKGGGRLRYHRNGSLVRPKQNHNFAHRRSLQFTRPNNYGSHCFSPFNNNCIGLNHNSSLQTSSNTLESINNKIGLDEPRGSQQRPEFGSSHVEPNERQNDNNLSLIVRRQAVYKPRQ